MRSVVMNVSVRLEVVYSAEDIRGFEERRVDDDSEVEIRLENCEPTLNYNFAAT